MVKAGSSILTRDSAFVVDLVFDKTEHTSELGHEETTFNYYSTLKRVPLPDVLAKEEIISIKFVEASCDFLQVKTKSLKLVDLALNMDLDEESEMVQVIRVVENCPLETRSIFKMTGEKYNEIQEQTLTFMED